MLVQLHRNHSKNPEWIAELPGSQFQPLHQWAALLFDIGAVFVLVNPMKMTMDPIGLLLLFFTIFCYSLYAVIGKKMINELGSAMATGSTFIGSLTYFIKPALSPFMALLFLNEAITGRILLGVLLLLIGAAVSLCKDKAQPVLD